MFNGQLDPLANMERLKQGEFKQVKTVDKYGNEMSDASDTKIESANALKRALKSQELQDALAQDLQKSIDNRLELPQRIKEAINVFAGEKSSLPFAKQEIYQQALMSGLEKALKNTGYELREDEQKKIIDLIYEITSNSGKEPEADDINRRIKEKLKIAA